jgi:hypothetical protein
MSERFSVTTRRRPSVPALPAGTLLAVDGTDWSYGRGQQQGTRLTLVVIRVRTELADCYGGEWAWVDGHATDCDRQHEPCRQALVRVAALPAS